MTSTRPTELSRATHTDLPTVLALLRDCGLLATGVAEGIEGFVVAHSTGSLVGCAGLEVYGELGLLRSVAVRRAARSTGLGSEIVTLMAATARGQGLRALFLFTTTAGQFLEKRGFEPVQRSSVPSAIAESWEYRVGCPQTALAMRLALKVA